MSLLKKTVRSTSIFMATVLFLFSTAYQSASAAMIGTEQLLQAKDPQEIRDNLQNMLGREEVKNALLAWGLDPLEARLRIQSLSDREVQMMAHKINSLPAGGGVEIFSLIVIAVIIATVLVFKFTNITDVFP